MSATDYTIAGLEKAREQRVGMAKPDLTRQVITNWCTDRSNSNAFRQQNPEACCFALSTMPSGA